MTLTDAAAGAADSQGLAIRPYAGEVDNETIVRIQNAQWEADGLRDRISLAEVDAWLRYPSEQFDPARDLRVAELDGGAVAVTWTDWVDATDGVREYTSRGYVHPAYRRRGIGRVLLADNLRHMRALAASHDIDRPKVAGLGSYEQDRGAHDLARSFGYEPVRWFFHMERPLAGELPPVIPLPDGIELRPVTAEDGWAIWQADHDAFRDHWGGHEDSEASFRRWVDSPEFEPSLFVVAYDGDEISGAVLNAIYPEANEELGIRRGWLDSVFTRRAWRRRGLARALIVRSLHLLRERAMDTAALGVDADNPSGALGLYESVGFAVAERFTAWRRPLEDAP